MKIKKVLIIRFSSLGDVILALPVASAIKQHYPDATVDFLTKELYADIFDQFPAVTTVYAYNNNLKSVLRQLRANKYDTVIDLQKNPRSLIVAAGLTPKNVVGYPKRRFKREMIIRRPHKNWQVGHTVDAYLQVLSRLKIKRSSRRPRVELQTNIREYADDYLNENGLRGKIIGLCPGAKHFEKRWPGYQQLAEILLQDSDKSVIVFTGPDDPIDPALNIKSERLKPVHNLKIDRVGGLMSRCDLVVTNDSGLMHLAVALSVPVVSIFGPTNPSLGFSPLGESDSIICDNIDCSPCSLHGEKKCKMPGKLCFDNVSPERIKAEVDTLLNEKSKSQIS